MVDKYPQRKITVFHPAKPEINGGNTVFYGRDLEYRVSGEGDLLIVRWDNDGKTGTATFARGCWSYVLAERSAEKIVYD